jgi:hypothetical protein
MRTAPEKKFLIVTPVRELDTMVSKTFYFCAAGRGNTYDINSAYRYGEKQAKEIVDKEPLLKMIPAPI